MTTESNNENTTEATTSPQAGNAPQQGRRNFLKGTSLALPAAMTLTPGTAMALASITCGQKALDSNLSATVLIDQGADDGFFRVDVDVYDALVEVTTPSGPELQPNGVPTYFFDAVQGVWRNAAGGSLGAGEPTDKGPNSVVKRAIVHIDATDGSPVSNGAGTAPNNAIITSAAGACMASLMQHNP